MTISVQKKRRVCLIYIMLVKNKKAHTKQSVAEVDEMLAKKKDIKILGFYWTLGQYDDVVIVEAPSAKDIMKLALDVKNMADTQTLVAIPREEAIKLL